MTVSTSFLPQQLNHHVCSNLRLKCSVKQY